MDGTKNKLIYNLRFFLLLGSGIHGDGEETSWYHPKGLQFLANFFVWEDFVEKERDRVGKGHIWTIVDVWLLIWKKKNSDLKNGFVEEIEAFREGSYCAPYF